MGAPYKFNEPQVCKLLHVSYNESQNGSRAPDNILALQSVRPIEDYDFEE